VTSPPIDDAPWERGLVLTDSRPRSIRDALREVAHALPDHLAVDDGTRQLTFAEFVRSTERVARAVRAAEGDPNEPVSVVVGHGVDALVVIVGVIVSGRIAAPIDRNDPVERVRAIHQAAGSSLVVSDGASAALAHEVGRGQPVIVLGDHGSSVDEVAPDELTIAPESLAILFFTSGSTGVPKGVARTHRHAVTSACRIAYSHRLTAEDRVGLEGSLSFSAAYNRVWAGLLNGVTLSCYDTQRDGARGIAAWANANGVTITGFIPSVFRALASATPDARMDSVRLVTFGGEVVFGADVRRARPMFRPGTELRNRLGAA